MAKELYTLDQEELTKMDDSEADEESDDDGEKDKEPDDDDPTGDEE